MLNAVWPKGEFLMIRFDRVIVAAVFLCLFAPCCCGGVIPPDLLPRDAASLINPSFRRSEIVGFVAGFGTTFAALPDLISMLMRRSTVGMNPRMAAIMGIFQIVWVYYGLLIASRPVIVWNLVAIFINFLSVKAYRHFRRRERTLQKARIDR